MTLEQQIQEDIKAAKEEPVFEGHDHNETCWAKRLAEPITFLLQ
jgi:hypothetical protein